MAKSKAKAVNLRWSHETPPSARFDWGSKDTGTAWLYASRGGVSVAVWFVSPEHATEIDVSPIEVGPYAWEGQCASLDDAKAKAVELVQASLSRLSKSWGLRAAKGK